MDFALLIIVTAILRIRPTDIIPGLESFQLYYIAILCCLVLSLENVGRELSAIFAGRRPVAAFMLGILVLIPMSDFIYGAVSLGIDLATEYLKVLIYFILLVSIVNTPRRLRWFVVWVILIDMVPTTLALLHHHGYTYIAAYDIPEHSEEYYYDEEAGKVVIIRRLIASGMFGDPNDFSQILNTGLMFCLAGLLDRAAGLLRVGWLLPMLLFGYAVKETGSRGGVLGTLAGLGILLLTRYGTRRTLMLMTLLMVLLLPMLSGRLAGAFSPTEGTGQVRVQIWDLSYNALLHSPVILGVGANRHKDVVGKPTHNGFLCAFTELGFIGGSLFLGSFYWVISSLWRLASSGASVRDPTVRRLTPYILAAIVCYAVNEFTLTHPFAVVTYMMLGLGTACVELGDPDYRLEGRILSSRLFTRIFGVSIAFLVVLYVFVRVSLRY